jgi:hypothetical protein
MRPDRRRALARALGVEPDQIAHVHAMGDRVMRFEEIQAESASVVRRLAPSSGPVQQAAGDSDDAE